MIANDRKRVLFEYSSQISPPTLPTNHKIKVPSCEKLCAFFKKTARKIDRFVRDPNSTLNLAFKGIAIVLSEPHCALKIVFNSFVYGTRKKFNYHDLNPTKITEEDSEKQPTLLLHGGFHNQGVWIDLAREIQQFNKLNKQKSLGPVYTFNFATNEFSKKDIQLFNQKIAEIKAQYMQWDKEDVKVNLVGYCAGGSKAAVLKIDENCWRLNTNGYPVLSFPIAFSRQDIGKIIGICMLLFWETNANKVHKIQGRQDLLFPTQPSSETNFIVDSGHLGTIFSKDTHQKVIEWLAQDSMV